VKQTLFLVVSMLVLTFRSVADPFWAVLMYYGLAVLRPQAIWEWALPPGVRWSLIAAVVAILASGLHFASLSWAVVQKWFLVMIGVLATCLVGSWAYALNQQVAGEYGLEYAKILVMLLVASLVVRQRRHFRYLAWMIFGCLIYLVYEMNALYVFDGRLDIYHRGYAGYDNNGAALMLAMVIPFCYFFFRAERRWWRWAYLLCVIPAFHVLMLSYSRGAMLAALLVGVGMVVGDARRRAIRTACVAVVVGWVLLALAGPQVRARFLSISQRERDASARSRIESWRAGWAIAKDYPLFGVGLRNSNALIGRYGADREGRTIHNVYLQFAADAGIPAGATFTGLVVASLWWLRRAARSCNPEAKDTEERWHHYICRACFWSLAIFAIGAMFLSFEAFELAYLLMLMAAVSVPLAVGARVEAERVLPNEAEWTAARAGIQPGSIGV